LSRILPKKAFTGKNSFDKNPIYLDVLQTQKVPEKVETVFTATVYTVRKDISPDLKIEKVIDSRIKAVLQSRLNERIRCFPKRKNRFQSSFGNNSY